jgi:hypothetical protein
VGWLDTARVAEKALDQAAAAYGKFVEIQTDQRLLSTSLRGLQVDLRSAINELRREVKDDIRDFVDSRTATRNSKASWPASSAMRSDNRPLHC